MRSKTTVVRKKQKDKITKEPENSQITEFRKQLRKIDKHKISDEVFKYLIDNVPNCINDESRNYSVTIPTNKEKTPELLKLQMIADKIEDGSNIIIIRKGVEDIGNEVKIIEIFDKFTSDIAKIMRKDKDNRDSIVKRFCDFYSADMCSVCNINCFDYCFMDLETSVTPLVLIENKDDDSFTYVKNESAKRTEFSGPAFDVNFDIV